MNIFKIIKYISFKIKSFLSPIKTLIKYPNVQIQGSVILNNCSVANNVKVYHNTQISNTRIEAYTYIGGNSKIMNCSIGKFCSIAPNVKIGLGIHPTNYISTYPGFYSNSASGAYKFHTNKTIVEHKPITIKNDVWIGDGATIMDGITIGNGAIIAGGSMVTKDVPDYAIVGGIPAKIIKYRFTEEELEKLKEIQWWDKDLNYLKEKASLFLNVSKFFEEF